MDAETSRILHLQAFEVSNAPGAIGLTPNSEAPVLEPARVYKFFCGSSSQAGLWQEEGLIIRRSRSLSVEGLTGRERSDRYAENGFWYDALTELAVLLQANPTDREILRDWAGLLEHPSVQKHHRRNEMTAIATID